MPTKYSSYEARPFENQKVMKQCINCFAGESERIAQIGNQFIVYFMENATQEGVLFKTIKEITMDLNVPHQNLSKVLKTLEDNRVIYKRNGIIGLATD